MEPLFCGPEGEARGGRVIRVAVVPQRRQVVTAERRDGNDGHKAAPVKENSPHRAGWIFRVEEPDRGRDRGLLPIGEGGIDKTKSAAREGAADR